MTTLFDKGLAVRKDVLGAEYVEASIKNADDFMSGNAGKLNTRPPPFFHQCIAVADAAGLYLDSHRTRASLGNIALDELERSLRRRDLHAPHLRHRFLRIHSRSWHVEGS